MLIFKNRYQARKAAAEANVLGVCCIVKVSGGFTVMSPQAYEVWKKQK